jgi:trimeric autotransporter adhesin
MKTPIIACYAACSVLLGHSALAATPESIHPNTVTPIDRLSDAPSWELGTVFRPAAPGKITAVKVFSLAEESGDHEVRIWRNSDNTLLAGPIPWFFGGDENWIMLDIPDVAVQANTDYTVSVSSTADGWYPSNAHHFDAVGSNGSYLLFPAAAGVFNNTLGNRPAQSFNNSSYLRDVVFEADLSAPVLKVVGNGVALFDGDATPSTADATQFGTVQVSAGSRDVTFTIENTGGGNLELTGNPKVALTGAGAADFIVLTAPTSPVPPGGKTSFTIRFDPSIGGPRVATVQIAHSANPGDPFDFAIEGMGLSGGSGVIGNDSEGVTWVGIGDGQIHGNRFQSPRDMQIKDIWAKLVEAEGNFKCAVYSETNGVASEFLRGTLEAASVTNGWNNFTLTAPLDLKAGEYYWLTIWANTTEARVQYELEGSYASAAYSYWDLLGEWPPSIALNPGDNPRTYCLYAEGRPTGAVPGPAADIRGNGKLIVVGDTTPSVLDGTDFGSIGVGTSRDQVFTIENPGDTPLTLSGNPLVTVVGPHASDFVLSSPPAATVAPGGNARFTITFRPGVRGLRTATVSVANNNPGTDPYQFSVQGAGYLTGRESIWPDTKTAKEWVENSDYELGMIFQASVKGKVTHARVYAVARERGDHSVRLWRNSDETLIAGPYTWNYGGTTGWITFDIPDVDIDADTEYTIAISTASAVKNYANIAADVARGGNNGQHLSYPNNAGVFTTTLGERPAQSYNGGNYLRDIVFVPAGASVDIPDIEVRGNNSVIADGARAPGSADGTDFGQAAMGGGTAERTFTIRNTGAAPLNLSATPRVSVSGAHAADFKVVTQPSSPVAEGGSATFTVRFTPGAAGAREAILSIDNDSDKNPYDFAIAGTGGGAALKIVEVKADRAAGSITLRWEGGQNVQIERATSVTGPYQSVGTVPTGQIFTHNTPLTGSAFYRVRQQ